MAHGSADPRAAATIGELMGLVDQGRRAASVPDLRAAYLGHAAPSVPQVCGALRPGRAVTVLPLLLTAAYHSKTDIPRMLAQALPRGPGARTAPPLGPHPLLLRALERRLAEAALQNPDRARPRGPRRGRLERPRGQRHHRAPGRAAGRPGRDGTRCARPTPQPPTPHPARP